ncbi:MAG: CHAT domain-containing tetratricopeptide repeat protein [Chitinophagales bacterium]
MKNKQTVLEEAVQYLAKAEEWNVKGNRTETLRLSKQAVEVSEMAEDWSIYGRAMNLVVEGYLSQGREEDAIEWIGRLEHVFSDLEEMNGNYAYLYASRAKLMKFRGDTDAILDSYHKIVRLLSAVLHPDLFLLSEAYTQIGSFYLEQNDTQQALLYLQKSLSIVLPEDDSRSIHHFLAYAHLARYYGVQGAYNKAIDYQEKTLHFVLKHYPEGHKMILVSYIRIGAIYILQSSTTKAEGDYQKAIYYFNRVLESHDPQLEPVALAAAYQNLGYVYLMQKKYWEAMPYLTKALEMYGSFFGAKHPYMGQMHNNIGNVYLGQKEYESAKQSFQNALDSLYPDIHIRQDCFLQPPLGRSTNLFQAIKALKGKGETFFSSFVSSAGTLKELEFSIETYSLACLLFDQARTSYDFDESKFSLGQMIESIYLFEGGLETALKAEEEFLTISGKGGGEWAFYFCEKAKANVLMNALQDNWAKALVNISADLLQKEKELKTSLTQLDKNIQKLSLKQEKTPFSESELLQLQSWQAQFFETHHRYVQLKDELEQDYPDYFQLKYDTQTVEIAALQKVLAENQVLLNYFIARDYIYIFVITPDDFEIVQEIKPDDFEGLVTQFLAAIRNHESAQYVSTAAELYRLLLQSVEDYFVNPFDVEEDTLKHLVIVPNDVLCYIPFEALLKADSHYSKRVGLSFEEQEKEVSLDYASLDYLLKYVAVSYHYSASLFYFQHQQQARRSRKRYVGHFAGFAPVYQPKDRAAIVTNGTSNATFPSFSVVEKTVPPNMAWAIPSEAFSSDGNFAPLPYSELEVKNIAALFAAKGFISETYLHKAATKEQFERVSNGFKYLLVAAHGLVNDEQTSLSGLVFHPNLTLSGDTNFSVSDRILSMEEIYHLDLQADLVVLSSCDSGIGKLVKGEGMIAVNRGFLYSGANHIISTLFKVYDKPSSILTQYLFEEILKGANYTLAIRMAKLRLLEMKEVDVKSWCGFVLIGG